MDLVQLRSGRVKIQTLAPRRPDACSSARAGRARERRPSLAALETDAMQRLAPTRSCSHRRRRTWYPPCVGGRHRDFDLVREAISRGVVPLGVHKGQATGGPVILWWERVRPRGDSQHRARRLWPALDPFSVAGIGVRGRDDSGRAPATSAACWDQGSPENAFLRPRDTETPRRNADEPRVHLPPRPTNPARPVPSARAN